MHCPASVASRYVVDALEAVVSTTRDASPRLTALLRPREHLRKACSRAQTRPSASSVLHSARPIRRTLAHYGRSFGASQRPPPPPARPRTPRRPRQSLPGLGRACGAVGDGWRKWSVTRSRSAPFFSSSPEIHLSLHDRRLPRSARWWKPSRTHPSNAKAFARSLRRRRARSPVRTPYPLLASAQRAHCARGQQLGKVDARWFATLGQLARSNRSAGHGTDLRTCSARGATRRISLRDALRARHCLRHIGCQRRCGADTSRDDHPGREAAAQGEP